MHFHGCGLSGSADDQHRPDKRSLLLTTLLTCHIILLGSIRAYDQQCSCHDCVSPSCKSYCRVFSKLASCICEGLIMVYVCMVHTCMVRSLHGGVIDRNLSYGRYCMLLANLAGLLCSHTSCCSKPAPTTLPTTSSSSGKPFMYSWLLLVRCRTCSPMLRGCVCVVVMLGHRLSGPYTFIDEWHYVAASDHGRASGP